MWTGCPAGALAVGLSVVAPFSAGGGADGAVIPCWNAYSLAKLGGTDGTSGTGFSAAEDAASLIS